MFGLEDSGIIGVGYTLYNIPNIKEIKIAISDDGGFVTLVSRDPNSMGWFRLGDRPDLKPDQLKYFGLTSCRTTDKKTQEDFIKKVLIVFG